jgi:hypothetical protein
MNKAVQAALYGGEKLKETYQRYERFLPAVTFFAGMLFDVLTLGRIDQLSNLIQLGVYVVVCGAFLVIEVLDDHRPIAVSERFAKLWKYREEVMHFFLGSLLSAFAIFYFKSSSFVASLVFYLVIAALLVGNEFSELRRVGPLVRTILFAVCATSYFFCLIPIWWGRVGILPFFTALVSSGVLFTPFALFLWFRIRAQDQILKKLVYPYAATLATFLIFYLLRVIPPVPLSLTHVGIYHDVRRVKGGYEVTSTRPRWKLWQNGDQSFAAKPGDKVYCFFSIFSPGGFKDSIKIRWLYDDPKSGWTSSDAVPVAITGGREEGWRGYAFKANYKPGDWQVRVETSDEREIGRIHFTVEAADGGSDEPFREVL